MLSLTSQAHILKKSLSLDSYKYLLAAWVGNLSIHIVAGGGKKMVYLPTSPLKPWVAAEKSIFAPTVHA